MENQHGTQETSQAALKPGGYCQASRRQQRGEEVGAEETSVCGGVRREAGGGGDGGAGGEVQCVGGGEHGEEGLLEGKDTSGDERIGQAHQGHEVSQGLLQNVKIG
jgi:hypothetical protein